MNDEFTDHREKLLSMLPAERQVKIRGELELLKSLRISAMSDAALYELFHACAEELARRDQLEKLERDRLRGLVREIVDDGRADPTVGWFRRAREALRNTE